MVSEVGFAVATDAAAWAAAGNTVYPFHLGDMNIKTPQNIIDAAFKAATRATPASDRRESLRRRDGAPPDTEPSPGTTKLSWKW